MKARILVVCLCAGALAQGETRKAGSVPALPAALVHPDPAGILFPSLNTAAGVNPAVLGNFGKGTSLQLAYSPATADGDSQGYFASLGYARRQFGFGLGVDGAFGGSGGDAHGGFVGMGFNLEKIAMGLAVRDADLSDSVSPSVDIGTVFGEGKGLNFGFVLHHLERSPQLNLGVGYASGKRFNLEVNLLLPPFDNLGGNDYQLTLGTNIYIGILSVYFRTSYLAAPDEIQHSLGAGLWLNALFHAGVQYTTPRLWTFSLTFVF